MCKIFTLTNMSKVKSPKKLINLAADALSDYERDGFGYSIFGESGVFGERTTQPTSFKTQWGRPDFSAPYVNSITNRYGEYSTPIGAGIFHGRTSTNDKTLINTHPIVKNDWHLIHNGVVSNHGPKYETTTTNDTEHLVQYLSTVGVSGIEEHLTGYYAISAIAPDGMLHILRDSRAPLYVAHISTIDSQVFATTPDLIETICKEMKWKHSIIKSMNDNTYIVMSLNDIVSHATIKPRGETKWETQYSSKSLGYDIGNEDWRESRRASITNIVDATQVNDGAPNVTKDLLNDNLDYMSDEDLFLRETIHFADRTYKYSDFRDNEISREEFLEMSDDDKLTCIVIRPDGTVVDQYNYSANKLYGA